MSGIHIWIMYYRSKGVQRATSLRRAVLFKYLLSTATPRIEDEQSTTYATCRLNTTVALTCYATSARQVSYRWSKEGKPLTGENMKILNNFLVVRPQSQKDFGTNIAGSKVHQIQLEEQKQSSEVKAQGEEDLTVI